MSPTKESGALGHLIDRHMAMIEVRRRLAEEGAGTEELRTRQGPWITFSKELGSGGIVIARQTGERLGWQVFDKEVLEEIARNTHTRNIVLSRLDERAVSHFDELVSNILLPVEQAQLAFLHEMTKVIWALAREGHAILVGRGANWLLDARFGLRVRIVAPPEHRAERIMRERTLSLPEAQRLIRDDDARRASFIRQAYGKDIADPLGYDLVLNTAALDTDTAAGIVLSVLHQKVGVTT